MSSLLLRAQAEAAKACAPRAYATLELSADLAQAVRTAMRARHLSFRQLAAEMGCGDPSNIRKWLSGKAAATSRGGVNVATALLAAAWVESQAADPVQAPAPPDEAGGDAQAVQARADLLGLAGPVAVAQAAGTTVLEAATALAGGAVCGTLAKWATAELSVETQLEILTRAIDG